MRIEDIFNKSEFRGSLIGTETFGLKLNLFIPKLKYNVILYIDDIPSQNLNTQVFLKLETIVNSLIGIQDDKLAMLNEELWNRYIFCCENTEPNISNSTFSVRENNMQYFNIFKKEELISTTYLSEIYVNLNNIDEDEETFYSVYYKSDWIGDGFYSITLNSEMSIFK